MNPRLPHLAVVLALAAAGCIDDPTLTADGIPLSQREAQLLGVEFVRQAFENGLPEGSGDGAAAGEVARAPVFSKERADITVPCPLGGGLELQLELTVAMDDETGVGTLALEMVKRHRSCVLEQDGVTFTVNGDPDLATALELYADGTGRLEIRGSLRGGVDVSADGRTGVCRVALDMEGEQAAGGALSYRVTGRSCGHPVDERVTAQG